ncbi:universal stress protein [Zunongwangia sp.]|uniref:universal stress protein n=1 Tax=Zunongwangia sp. TaxID=1965325 RepID=UPI003AA9AA85
MDKILVTLDYHPNSEKVAVAAYELAKKMNAELRFLHVLGEISQYGVDYTGFLGYEGYTSLGYNLETENELEKMAIEFLDTAKKQFSDDRISTALEIGAAEDGILRHAKKWGADLIVMGTHSHSTIEKILVGTVASKILEKTTIPVYMIPIKK